MQKISKTIGSLLLQVVGVVIVGLALALALPTLDISKPEKFRCEIGHRQQCWCTVRHDTGVSVTWAPEFVCWGDEGAPPTARATPPKHNYRDPTEPPGGPRNR